MKNLSSLPSKGQLFGATAFLFLGLLNFQSALSYDGLENQFLADNWGIPVAMLLTIVFVVGWWFEDFAERLAVSKGRKFFILAFLVLLLTFLLLGVGSLILARFTFLQAVASASGFILVSGFSFRFSMARPEVIAKLQEHS